MYCTHSYNYIYHKISHLFARSGLDKEFGFLWMILRDVCVLRANLFSLPFVAGYGWVGYCFSNFAHKPRHVGHDSWILVCNCWGWTVACLVDRPAFIILKEYIYIYIYNTIPWCSQIVGSKPMCNDDPMMFTLVFSAVGRPIFQITRPFIFPGTGTVPGRYSSIAFAEFKHSGCVDIAAAWTKGRAVCGSWGPKCVMWHVTNHNRCVWR